MISTLLKIKKKLLRVLHLERKEQIKMVIGANGKFEPGWFPTDIDTLNILNVSHWENFNQKFKITAMLAEHVWEHLTEADGLAGAKNCYRYMQKGGYFRIAVPDGYHPDKAYIDHVKPGGIGIGADDHKVLYNYKTFRAIFEKAGFKVRLLEYFDEHGNFHYNEWNKDDGLITRSKRYDQRNADGKLNYTSLILDAIK